MRADRGLIAAWSGSRVNFTSRRRSHFRIERPHPLRARQNQFSLVQQRSAARRPRASRRGAIKPRAGNRRSP